MKKTKIIEFDVLPSGEVRFDRTHQETDYMFLELLEEIVDVRDLREYFDCTNNIEVLMGPRSYCG